MSLAADARAGVPTTSVAMETYLISPTHCYVLTDAPHEPTRIFTVHNELHCSITLVDAACKPGVLRGLFGFATAAALSSL